jgi:hypothetical protein
LDLGLVYDAFANVKVFATTVFSTERRVGVVVRLVELGEFGFYCLRYGFYQTGWRVGKVYLGWKARGQGIGEE